jgi:hypothetical protein
MCDSDVDVDGNRVEDPGICVVILLVITDRRIFPYQNSKSKWCGRGGAGRRSGRIPPLVFVFTSIYSIA